MDTHERLEQQLRALRDDFDSAFALSTVIARSSRVSLMLTLVGEQQVAVRMNDVAEVLVDPSVTTVPSESPYLRGLTSVRGTVVAVFDLQTLLFADEGKDPGRESRWLLRMKGAPVAFAFHELRGLSLFAERQIIKRAGESAGTDELLETPEGSLVVIEPSRLVKRLNEYARLS